MEITPLGDSALIVRIAEDSKDALSAVLAAKQKLQRARIPGVIELAPAYTSVALFYDPLRVVSSGAKPESIVDWLMTQIRQALSKSKRLGGAEVRGHSFKIPVCFDPEFALDLDELARKVRIPVEQIVDRYCSVQYRVNCLGFTPGFPFLSGLPDELSMPRRTVPRKEVPAGSVAIGGGQTGIYPAKSPGGWNIIGRTPVCLFDPKRNPPALFRAGDRIRFRAIPRDEFEISKM